MIPYYPAVVAAFRIICIATHIHYNVATSRYFNGDAVANTRPSTETKIMKTFVTGMAVAAMGLLVGTAQADFTAGFDGGSDDGFTGNFVFEDSGGNPGGNARINAGGPFFFPSLRTGGIGEPANDNFLGDFSGAGQITIGFDVRVESLTDFIGNEIFRPLGIMLIDRDIQGGSGASGVFFETPVLGTSQQPDWTHYEVTIDDPTATELPSGWIGFGEEDPNTFEPVLPDGASFASVLAGVDEFRLTGAVPGFFFNNAFYDVRIDNISISTTAIPEPSVAFVVLLAGLAQVSRRRVKY